MEEPKPKTEKPVDPDNDIAVIGIGCRFPGGENPETFWELLQNGQQSIGKIPLERWDAENLYDPNPDTPGKINTRWGAFLSGIDLFDADFFEITPRETVNMDPQQRLLLEVAWEALENSGKRPNTLAESNTGVFIGISTNDYSQLVFKNRGKIDAYAGTGTSTSIAANRISYFLNLKGPSYSVDTACSSSLVAVHLACTSLKSGESNMAIAGAVNLILTPELNISLSCAHMMS